MTFIFPLPFLRSISIINIKQVQLRCFAELIAIPIFQEKLRISQSILHRVFLLKGSKNDQNRPKFSYETSFLNSCWLVW